MNSFLQGAYLCRIVLGTPLFERAISLWPPQILRSKIFNLITVN